MANINYLKNKFLAGEITPELLGRADLPAYANGCQTLENFVVRKVGGATRRDGTRFISAIKDSSATARLMPFVYSLTEAYILEVSHLNIRVYKDSAVVLNGTTPVDIVTPYTAAEIAELSYVQNGDIMYFCHPAHPPATLSRTSDIAWTLAAMTWDVPAYKERGETPATALTLSLATVGSSRTATAGAAIFLAADVGRTLSSGVGVATITNVVSSTVATITIETAFAGTALASGAWVIEGSPQVSITPNIKEPVGSVCTLTSGSTAAIPVFAPEYVGLTITDDATGVATITAYISSTNITVDISSAMTATSISSGDWFINGVAQTQTLALSSWNIGTGITATAGVASGSDAWKDNAQYSHVGKWVAVNGGVVEITSVTPNVATGIIRKRIPALDPALAGTWSVNSDSWTALDGYPRTVSVFEQRLCFGGTTTYPRTIWGSRSADFANFALGTADDDAFAFTIPVDRGGIILHMVSTRVLVILTYGGELTISGGSDKGVTPTNVAIRQQTAHGTKLVKPFRIGAEVFFMQRSGLKLRSTGYKFESDAYVSEDVTILSPHLTAGSPILECSYVQEPDGIIWLCRQDGTLLSCTYDKQQNIIGWGRHTTNGQVESLASIPYGDSDQLWMVVKRGTTRTIEIMDSTLNTDSAVTASDVTGKTTWTGLTHLNGYTVDVLADGVYQTPLVVSGGSITLARAASAVEIGIHYDSTIIDMPLEITTNSGTAFGENVSVNEIVVRMYETIGMTVNGETPLAFRSFGTGILDAPLTPYTGDKRTINLAQYDNGGVVTIQQTQPYNCTVLAIIKKVTVNSG